jgi:flagellar motor switch protein FliN/FliY
MSDMPVADPSPSPDVVEKKEASPALFAEEFQEQAGSSSPGLGGSPGAGAPSARRAADSPEGDRLDLLMDVNLEIAVELGRTRLSVRQVLDLQKGSVVELERIAGEAVDILINDHLMARGEVVVVDDRFGVRITEIITPKNNKRGEI